MSYPGTAGRFSVAADLCLISLSAAMHTVSLSLNVAAMPADCEMFARSASVGCHC